MEPATRKRVGEILGQIAEEVERLPEPVLREFLPVVQKAHDELRRDLRKWLDNVEDGGDKFTAFHYRQALLQLDTALTALEKRVPAELRKQMHKAGPRLSKAVRENLVNSVERVGQALGAPLISIPIRPASVVAAHMKARIRQHEKSFARYGENMTQNIRRELAIGVVKGETFDQMTRRLMRLRAESELPKKFVDRASRISSVFSVQHHAWAERLVRTEVLDAYNQGFKSELEQLEKDDPGWQKRWDATLDGRVCPWCRSLDGKTAGVGDSFEPGVDRPPLHPNCRCGITPWREEWGDEGVMGIAPASGSPSSPPPGRPDEPELAQMPKASAKDNGRLIDQLLDIPADADNAWMTERLSTARVTLDEMNVKRGYSAQERSLTETPELLRTMRISNDLPLGIAGHREWSGRIEIQPHVADDARRFATKWAANAKQVQEELKAVAAKYIGPANELTARIEKLKPRIAAAKSDAQREKLTAQLKTLRAERGKVEHEFFMSDEYNTHWQMHSVRTLKHESLHGSGPATVLAYERQGAVVEEITTEVMARRQMIDDFKIPKALFEREGPYGWLIDPLTDDLAEIYGVSRREARTILESACDQIKRSTHRVVSSSDFVDEFVHVFPKTGDPTKDTPRKSLLTKFRGEDILQTDAQWQIGRSIYKHQDAKEPKSK